MIVILLTTLLESVEKLIFEKVPKFWTKLEDLVTQSSAAVINRVILLLYSFQTNRKNKKGLLQQETLIDKLIIYLSDIKFDLSESTKLDRPSLIMLLHSLLEYDEFFLREPSRQPIASGLHKFLEHHYLKSSHLQLCSSKEAASALL